MATIRWTGEAAAVAQVDKFTPANVEVDDVFTLTITDPDGRSHSVSFTATAATVANVTAGLVAAWNAETNALCTPITAADETTYLTLTADTAGEAFSVASSATNGGATDDQTLTRAAETANSGPKDWSCADNWSGGAVPGGAADQDVYIEDATDEIIYGLDQSGIANALASLNISKSFTGKIGPDGADGFAGDYLQIKTAKLNIGYHYGSGTVSGSGRVKIDTGSTACDIVVDDSGTAADTGKPAVRLLANSASTTIEVTKGTVGVGWEAGETATVSTITVSYATNVASDADVFVGEGVTLTTLDTAGGETLLRCAATTITQRAGTVETVGTGAVTTANVHGGTFTGNSTGTVTNLNVYGGTADFSRSSASRTVSTPKVDPGGVIKFNPSVVTLTNKIQPIQTSGVITYTAA